MAQKRIRPNSRAAQARRYLLKHLAPGQRIVADSHLIRVCYTKLGITGSVPSKKDPGKAREIVISLAEKIGMPAPSMHDAPCIPLTTPAMGTKQLWIGDPKEGYVDPRSPDFLTSRAWLRLRYDVLKARGARCDICGASRADGIVVQVDHIKPRSLYPELALDFDNCQVACRPCNMGKGARDQTDWR